MQTGQNQIVTRARIEFRACIFLPLGGVESANSEFDAGNCLKGDLGKSISDLAIK